MKDKYFKNNIIVIDKNISCDEVLVRYVFSDDFKGNSIHPEKIISKNLLGPLKGGTSLQREKYCDENKCLELGNKIPNKTLVGFLLFTKKIFEFEKDKFIESIDNIGNEVLLDAYLKATPLDENFNELDFSKQVISTKTKGNPAHADLIYLKPKSIDESDYFYERPNTIIRSFSKKMFLSSKLVLNESHVTSNQVQVKFKDLF